MNFFINALCSSFTHHVLKILLPEHDVCESSALRPTVAHPVFLQYTWGAQSSACASGLLNRDRGTVWRAYCARVPHNSTYYTPEYVRKRRSNCASLRLCVQDIGMGAIYHVTHGSTKASLHGTHANLLMCDVLWHEGHAQCHKRDTSEFVMKSYTHEACRITTLTKTLFPTVCPGDMCHTHRDNVFQLWTVIIHASPARVVEHLCTLSTSSQTRCVKQACEKTASVV